MNLREGSLGNDSARCAVRHVPIALGVLCAASIGYSFSLNNAFSLDDYNWLSRLRFQGDVFAFLFAPEPGQFLVPIAKLWLLLVNGLGGLEPGIYHLAVFFQHVVNGLLLAIFVYEVSKDATWAVLSGAVFICHGALYEGVYWVSAFFHPLVSTGMLATLLFYHKAVVSGRIVFFCLSIVFFLMSLLTKSVAVGLLPLLFLLRFPRRTFELWFLGILTVSMFLVLALTVSYGSGDSYLISRGYYQLGPHLLPNVIYYLARLFFPFELILTKIVSQEVAWLVLEVCGVLVFVALFWILLRGKSNGSRKRISVQRYFLSFVVITLLVYLPFTLAPTSRYTYVPALGASVLIASGMQFLLANKTKRVLAVSVCSLWFACSFVECFGRDHGFVEREQFMQRLIEDVVAKKPSLSKNSLIRVYDFPRLAIDRGIHFEAALRLQYDDPRLRLVCLPEESEGSARHAGVSNEEAALSLCYREKRLRACGLDATN